MSGARSNTERLQLRQRIGEGELFFSVTTGSSTGNTIRSYFRDALLLALRAIAIKVLGRAARNSLLFARLCYEKLWLISLALEHLLAINNNIVQIISATFDDLVALIYNLEALALLDLAADN